MNDSFRKWAENYGGGRNALLRLADRTLGDKLGDLRGQCVVDAGCGTGWWMRRAAACGARVSGFDRERAMLERGPRSDAVEAVLGRAAFRAGSFDLALAVFSLSYSEAPGQALADLCGLIRPAGRIGVADLHPDAVEAGWRRTFRYRGKTVEIPSRVGALEAALRKPPQGWRVESLDSARFGEPERSMFEANRWAKVEQVWAVRIAVWRRVE